jgi:hypothetical protein
VLLAEGIGAICSAHDALGSDLAELADIRAHVAGLALERGVAVESSTSSQSRHRS